MSLDKPSILIIEDVDEDIEILRAILKNDFQLHIAKTAEVGLQTAAERQPDLILLDIVLPDKTGFAVLEELKASCETTDIPVVIITSADSAQNEERGLNLGAVDYIIKPFHHAVVTARIRTQIRILRYLRTVEQIGWTDAATGLPNRIRFEQQIAVEWERGRRERRPLGLLMISINRFKEYVDVHGTRLGDLVLQKAVDVMNRLLKRSQDSVFRYDIDRFVMLLPDADGTVLAAVAEAVRTGIETMQVRVLDSTLPSVTASVGAATKIPGPEDAPDGLIIEAEQLLSKAYR